MRNFPAFEEELIKGIHVSRDHPQYKVYLDYGLNRFNFGKFLLQLLLTFFKKSELGVLDVGCGVGGISAAFADESVFVISSEFNVNYKTFIRKIFYDLRKKPMILAADGMYLPFTKESFNVVLAIDLLEHVKDINVFIDELSRVIKKGGIICLTIAERFNWSNIKRDPHYGLFGVILLPRFLRKLIVVNLTKRNPTLDDYYWVRNYKEAFELFKKRGILLSRFSDKILGLKVDESFINIGSPKDSLYLDFGKGDLINGWHESENHGNYTQRWTKKRAGGHILIGENSYKLIFEVQCCHPEIERKPFECKILLQRKVIGIFELKSREWQSIQIELPIKLRRCRLMRFEIRVDRTWKPSIATGSADGRELGIAVKSIKCE
jgi:2-polyprenyl-3-methyl-5-hydroxy-6-metoxy-1,4-benzoquinol methylase